MYEVEIGETILRMADRALAYDMARTVPGSSVTYYPN
jgi:hypothetical protein